ncbi:flagellar filament capping protein FliD [Alphaproteobacteria bacterium]|nr:flagellar filament capping protein FliD [Alphaproteobacteria bacterium]
MAVDYLSAMNVGSGLNVTQIVDALVDAEKAPREAQLNENIEEKTVSISAFAEVKQEFNTLKTNLATLGQFSGLQVQTIGPTGTSTAISATVTNPSLVKPFDHNIVVNTIAQPQTISFSGYSAENATLDASNLAIDLGSWAVDAGGVYSFSANANVASKTIALDNTDTLATVRDKINQLNIGINASIIKISDTSYSLSLTSALGTKNQIRVQATSTSGTISNLSYDPATNGSGAANGGDAQKQVAAASDASLTFNGVTVSRSSNQISDLISGIKIDVKAVSASTEKITATYDQTLSLDAMKLFVEELNTVTKNLISLGKTNLKEEDSGPLAGDTLVRSYRNKLRLMTTTPISGYGVDDIYLSNFGVMTNRDGSLSLDEAKFKSYFTAKPEQFSALTTSNVTTSSLSVAAEMTGSAWQPGTYQFNSVVRSATSVLSANEAVAQTFKSIDSAIGANDGQLSDSLEAYVAANAGGTWSITGTDSALLSIDTNGVVTVTGGTDYETKSSYAFTVEYAVSGSEKFSEAVTLNINNLAERKYTLSNATVPASVGAGDSFSITVDGQTITTAVIAAGGDNSYTLTKLVTALNLANSSADGSFTEDSGSLVFTYNDAATVQTSALTSGLIYNPASTLGTVSEQTSGAVTARTINFALNAEIEPSISSAVVSDVFKIDIQNGGNSYVVSHTFDAADVSAISALSSDADKVAYLAGKLDIAAGTAASGLDVGVDFAQSNGYLVGTGSIAGTDYNAATISQLKFSNDAGSNFTNLGAGLANTNGTSIAEIVKILAPSPPVVGAGDKFSVTLDNNGSNVTVTTAALSAGANLTAIKDALNTAHAAANGTFSVSGSDLLFTYNHNTGNISNTNDTGLTYIPAAGTIAQTVAGVDHPVLSTVTAVSHVAGAASATLDGAAMVLENGVFKITSGNARGIHITASGNNSASIYVGKSLFDTLKDFSDSVVKTNSDIDKKVSRYNSDIADYNEQLAALETRMENERARYVEQFTAMETAVSSFKETGTIIDNLMESWKASLS